MLRTFVSLCALLWILPNLVLSQGGWGVVPSLMACFPTSQHDLRSIFSPTAEIFIGDFRNITKDDPIFAGYELLAVDNALQLYGSVIITSKSLPLLAPLGLAWKDLQIYEHFKELLGKCTFAENFGKGGWYEYSVKSQGEEKDIRVALTLYSYDRWAGQLGAPLTREMRIIEPAQAATVGGQATF